MTSRELLAWGDLDDRRRRGAARGVRALPRWVLAALGGGLVAAELARRLAGGDSPVGASGVYLAALTVCNAIALLGAPFRLFWRRDAAMLSRLAIPGDALFRVGVVRSARAAGAIALAFALAAVPFAVWADPVLALRHLALAAVGAAAVAGLGPAVALAAGAVVASDKAQQVIESFAGEYRAPKTSWLGILPGFAGAGYTLAMTALAPWAGGRPGLSLVEGAVVAAGAAAACALALGAALARAGKLAGAAVREVAALDRQRLAHVDLSTPSPIERAWFGATLGVAARPIAAKDASLTRRRYPSPYFLAPLGTLALWILAGVRPDGVYQWSAAILGGMAVYAVVLARRLVAPPVESVRLLRTLAVAPADISRAKLAAVGLRAVVWIGLAGAPLAVLADDRMIALAIVAGSALVALVGGALAVTAGLDRGEVDAG